MSLNRSMPAASVIPVLHYDDVGAAAEWLGAAFGFVERLRIGDHRAQLTFGTGAIVAARRSGEGEGRDHSVLVRVPDLDAHFARATAAGARVVQAPSDLPFGERQYAALDLGGHAWTFSQTIADVDPAEWGGALVEDATQSIQSVSRETHRPFVDGDPSRP